METIMRYGALATTEQRFTATMLNDFVAYIDRTDKTTRTYLTNLRQFYKYVMENEITRPTRDDVIAFRDYVSSYATANTVSQYVRTIKQFFEWTELYGYYPNIAKNIHSPKVNHAEHKKDALLPEDVQKIEQSIDTSDEKGKRLKAMFLLTVTAGLRTIELARANIQDFMEVNDKYILYVYGKGHTEPDQKKYIPSAVGKTIQEYLRARTDRKTANSPLFVSTDRATKGGRIATTTISTMLKRAMQTAGYDSKRLTAHSLRHTTGTAVMNITSDIYQTQKYMRHASPQTTEIYIHEQETERESETAEKLYSYLHGENVQTADTFKGLSAEDLKELIRLANTMQTA